MVVAMGGLGWWFGLLRFWWSLVIFLVGEGGRWVVGGGGSGW